MRAAGPGDVHERAGEGNRTPNIELGKLEFYH